MQPKPTMKAYEFPAKLTSNGTLEVPPDLLESLPINQTVRVIVLLEETNGSLDKDEDENESPVESFRQAWHEAMTGQTLPVSQLWDSIDAE